MEKASEKTVNQNYNWYFHTVVKQQLALFLKREGGKQTTHRNLALSPIS